MARCLHVSNARSLGAGGAGGLVEEEDGSISLRIFLGVSPNSHALSLGTTSIIRAFASNHSGRTMDDLL
jgi:hypothetical protein